MNPHKMNKVDVKSMNEQDQKAFKLYGKLPAKTPLTMMQKDRKYFDSGDYAMSQAGKKSDAVPGREIPTPENVPHAALPSRHNSVTGHAFSPTGSPPAASPAHEFAQFGQLDRMPSNDQKGHVGVGISPDATTEAVDMPMPAARHSRRLSESHARISPPGTMREGTSPVSSFPIERREHHTHNHAAFGTSPVKSSTLAKRLDEEP